MYNKSTNWAVQKQKYYLPIFLRISIQVGFWNSYWHQLKRPCIYHIIRKAFWQYISGMILSFKKLLLTHLLIYISMKRVIKLTLRKMSFCYSNQKAKIMHCWNLISIRFIIFQYKCRGYPTILFQPNGFIFQFYVNQYQRR